MIQNFNVLSLIFVRHWNILTFSNKCYTRYQYANTSLNVNALTLMTQKTSCLHVKQSCMLR